MHPMRCDPIALGFSNDLLGVAHQKRHESEEGFRVRVTDAPDLRVVVLVSLL
jgi:hypothetical protein